METYTGSTAQTIKGRYNGHQHDMRHPDKSGTCLSKYIHKLIGQGVDYTVKWEILKKSTPWNPITNICRLCVLEKHHILFHPEDSSLNQRSEFFTVCRHKEKHLLMKTWTAFLFLNFILFKAFPFICSRLSKFTHIQILYSTIFNLVFLCSNYDIFM